MSEIVSSPSVVNEKEKRSLKHSFFPLHQLRFTTEQFGLVRPHVAFDGFSDDAPHFRSNIRTRSYTLKAPLLQDVHRRTTYIKVDLPAILPLNFDKIFTNPVSGEDVPEDAGCVVSNGYRRISSFVQALFRNAFDSSAISSAFSPDVSNVERLAVISNIFKALVLAELFYSRGSLLSNLGCHISKHFVVHLPDSYTQYSFDRYFDLVVSTLISNYLSGSGIYWLIVRIDSTNYRVSSMSDSDMLSYGCISWHAFFDLIRDTSDWEFVDVVNFDVESSSDSLLDFVPTFVFSGSDISDAPFNFERVCAYQLAIAEFFTNDHIDNNYSSELFRQYIGSLISFFSLSSRSFTVNGISYLYDFLSGHFLYSILNTSYASFTYTNFNLVSQYLLTLFGLRRSLRYKDYFVSSRISPLAVGDVNVNVVSNQVNVVDISRNIQRQRFFNRVNHIGRSLENYVRGIFGVDIKPDRHVPHYLVDFDELVYTSEVENTAEAQQTQNNSITATFTGNTGNKEIEVFCDVPCVIIGLQSYDIERVYIDNIERRFFNRNRFDMFVPELQFVGDQPIYLQELNSGDNSTFGTPFGYQYRDMQYKLLVNSADGGFVEFLPGYAFMFKNQFFGGVNQNSNFIRSLPAELDEFYLSMTGFSLASRFHFISMIENFIPASRPMIANPNILE